MAETPTFDYLTIINNQNGPCLAKYIVKSRSINFTYDANNSESYRAVIDDVTKYFDTLINDAPAENISMKKKLKVPLAIYLLRIYADSVTIRSNYREQRLILPLRSNTTNRLNKIPFVDISNEFTNNIKNFLLDLENAASEQVRA
jgi:hypothetical protein